jgi:hypothetical protein
LQGFRLQSRQDSNRLRLSFVQMPDDPTPLDSYRLHWDPCFDGDLMVALSLGDPRQHLPVAILKFGDSPREILDIARMRGWRLPFSIFSASSTGVRFARGSVTWSSSLLRRTRTGITLARRRLPAGFPPRT